MIKIILAATGLLWATVSANAQPNWIYTARGKSWFPYFRFYGPEQAFFNKTWNLPDIEWLSAI
jgi:hypothetical protein